jgi:hypothetical protein
LVESAQQQQSRLCLQQKKRVIYNLLTNNFVGSAKITGNQHGWGATRLDNVDGSTAYQSITEAIWLMKNCQELMWCI